MACADFKVMCNRKGYLLNRLAITGNLCHCG